MFELRRFIGSADVGWKVAWSDRMVSFYGGWFLFGLVYALVRGVRRRSLRGRVREVPGRLGLSWKAALVLLLPMVVDGLSHTISDLWGLEQGFRETNAWLASLTGNIFPAVVLCRGRVGLLQLAGATGDRAARRVRRDLLCLPLDRAHSRARRSAKIPETQPPEWRVCDAQGSAKVNSSLALPVQ